MNVPSQRVVVAASSAQISIRYDWSARDTVRMGLWFFWLGLTAWWRGTGSGFTTTSDGSMGMRMRVGEIDVPAPNVTVRLTLGGAA